MNNLKPFLSSQADLKMKKLFPNKKPKQQPNSLQIEHHDQIAQAKGGHTLDRIVNAKEEARRKWENQQADFVRLRRQHDMEMIAMESAEVARREEEIRRRNDDLDEKRRKNRMVQEAVQMQIKTLQEKLDEYRLNHKADEESMEDEITNLEDTLSEVKISLERRKEVLEQEMATPTAPIPEADTPTGEGDKMYPNLPVAMPRNTNRLSKESLQTSPTYSATPPSYSTSSTIFSTTYSATPTMKYGGNEPRKSYNSSGSSPQTSHASNSSRSATPKTDSSSGDFDTSV